MALGKFSALLHRARWPILIGWLGLVAAALLFAARGSDHLTGNGFNVPGSQSQAVQEAIDRDFGGEPQGALVVVMRATGRVGDRDRSAALARVRKAAEAQPDTTVPPAGIRRAARALRNGRVAVVPLDTNSAGPELIDTAMRLRQALGAGTQVGGVSLYLAGEPATWAALQDVVKQDLRSAERVGFPLVLLILLVVFGSVAAASLPLALGAISVLVTTAVIYFLAQLTEMSVLVTSMAAMIGIGVAVDYSLFILTRYRQAVASGADRAAARSTALATSGVAVVASGAAVALSLASLWLIDSTLLRSMAMGAVVVVSVSVLTAVVLLPVLIDLLGKRVEGSGRVLGALGRAAHVAVRRVAMRRGPAAPPAPAGEGSRFWQRWAALVMRRPLLAIAVVCPLLIVMALPVLSLRTGFDSVRQLPRNDEARVGAQLAASATRSGGAQPVQIVAHPRKGSVGEAPTQRAARALVATLARDAEVAAVARPRQRGSSVLIEATTRHRTESGQALAFIDRLRSRTLPDSQLARRADLTVGGSSASMRDVQAQISGGMWKLIAFVLGTSFLVLLVLLRSVLLPLKAVAMNLLSIGAAYGVLVAVFQWGWLDGLLGLQSLGHLEVFTPPLVMAVVFGLSMDYEVFLLSRIRERYEATGDSRLAVAQGLARSARTITSAALIMVAVFTVFIGTGTSTIQQLGLGSAVAIAIDATLVRLVVVPAIMQLLGDWNWWLPRPLERLLPQLGTEWEPPVPGTPTDAGWRTALPMRASRDQAHRSTKRPAPRTRIDA